MHAVIPFEWLKIERISTQIYGKWNMYLRPTFVYIHKKENAPSEKKSHNPQLLNIK